jgi:acid phosphatase
MKTSENLDIQNLTKSGVLLTSYYGLTHPSQPNYIASVGGDYFGLNSDGVVDIPPNVSTVVDLFDTKGISWKEYLEGLPNPGFQGTGGGGADGKWDYERKHKYVGRIESVKKC